MSEMDGRQDKGFPKWDGNLNKLFETLQNVDGSSVENYNHIISKLFQSIVSGNFTWVNGVPYIDDPLRGKKLSLTRATQSFGYYGPNQDSRYLRLSEVTTSGNGYMMMRDATITGLATRSRSPSAYQLEIRKNDNPNALYSLNANAGQGIADTLDIDLVAGDFVQIYLNGSSIDHPLAFLELAWRTT